MTDLFIRRPVVAIVLSLLILLLGGMGMRLLGVRETPDVDNPTVSVSTSWPGADPAIVETEVTEPLERQLNGIEGVRTLTSSSQDGRSQITVEFELDRDLEAAANDVRSRVGRARRRLPDDVDEPIVEKSDSSASPILFLSLAGAGKDLLEVTEIADTIVRDHLENTPGVSALDLGGARVYAIRLDVDTAAMAARNVTIGDIEAALVENNVELPVGQIEGKTMQLTLQLAGGLRTPEQFADLVIRTDDLAPVRIGDVAKVRLGAENERTGARADGVPTVSLSLTPQAKANVVDVSDEIRRRLPAVEADLPPGMSIAVIYDRAEAVRGSITDVRRTLFVAFALVIAVIFLFLRDWRSTLVPALAIPVSLIGTFFVLWLAGFTINVFTLFGLVLAIGLVVDDAIVVLENIVRRIEDGESVLDAALAGTRQIAMAVVATTVSLVVVFLPVIFTGGATGQLFLEFGITVAASVAISMVVALTLTPMLCSVLLKPSRATHGQATRLDRWFGAVLGVVIRRPWLVIPAIFGAVLVGGLGFRALPQEFFPTEDRDSFNVRIEAREGATFDWMENEVRTVEATLQKLVPERTMLITRLATGQGGVAAATNTASIQIPLVPREERDRTQQQIVDALRKPLAALPTLKAIPTQQPTVGRGSASPLQFVLQHPDFDTLAAELPKFVRAMRDLPGLSSVNEDLKLDRPELRLSLDRSKAAALGLPIRDVARTLQVLTGGLQISTFKRGVREYPVMAQSSRDGRDEPADLSKIEVRTTSGELVPVTNVLSWKERAGAATRFHYDRAPSATISANLDGITLGEGIQRVQALADDTLPVGFRTALAGQSKDFAEGASSLLQMFVLALGLVYLLLAAQFNSFLAPISIMLSVPLAIAGALGALWISGSTLSFFAQVGLILLVGLVTKNGILIVEYARQLRDNDGLEAWEAASQAARLRLRPILMTSVATIGGALPIAFGMSGSSRTGLGITVVGGMAFATVLTLFVTPVVYAALENIGHRRP